MSTTEHATATPPPGTDADGSARRVPHQAEELDLIGRYASSGFVDPPFLVRRSNGSTVQLPELLYLTLSAIDGERDLTAIADRVSDGFGREVTPDNIAYLLDEKLSPMGLAAIDGEELPEPTTRKQLLALTYRAALVPERVTHLLAKSFQWLFHPIVIGLVLAAAVAIDVWLFGVHGVGQTIRDTLYQPAVLLIVFALVVTSAAFHEVGHAAACRYSGATPGRMGAGLYLAWPVFYTDVTDAYRLDRRGRLRTDLGGVYFNVVFLVATFGAYALTGFEPLLVLIIVQHLEIAHQLLPFVRLDGYYIVADITGVPDLFSRIGPILKSFIPGRKTPPQVKELKPWARWTATAWAVLVIPLLLFNLGAIVLGLPRILSTAYDSALVQWDQIRDGGGLATAAGVVQLLVLALPIAAIFLMLWKLTKRAGTATWELTDGRPALRTGGVAVLGVAAIGAVFTLWPNGEYRPLQADERWNAAEVRAAIRDFSSGRPSLTQARQDELGGAPTIREQGGAAALEAERQARDAEDAGATQPTGGTSEPAGDEPTTGTNDNGADTTTEPSRDGSTGDSSTGDGGSSTTGTNGSGDTTGSTGTSGDSPQPRSSTEPTSQPTSEPSPEPSGEPSAEPSPDASAEPSPEPTASPTAEPTTSPGASAEPSPASSP